jgi:hypothetical protein
MIAGFAGGLNDKQVARHPGTKLLTVWNQSITDRLCSASHPVCGLFVATFCPQPVYGRDQYSNAHQKEFAALQAS